MQELIEACPSCGEPKCEHVAGMPFGIGVGSDGKPMVIAQPSMCCRCGSTFVSYLGIVEPGHGPHVKYELPPKIIPASIIELPNGMHMEARRV